MRNLLLVCTFLVVFIASCGLVLAQTGQTVAPPPAPTLLPLGSTSTACLTSCDTVAMNCQASCIPAGVSVTTTPPAPGACNNACTTQQLVCKQGCTR
jgi:hypothetical protein